MHVLLLTNIVRNIKGSLLLLVIFFLPFNTLFSQHQSRDNYTGDWENAESWDPVWLLPQSTISGYDITINGYITSNNSLYFTGAKNNLIINDTLVILGDLTVNNNNQILINDNGILIVRGNLIMENQSFVVANGYFIITGNLNKLSSIGQGSFTSNDDPVKIFIGGSITPSSITNNKINYPVLNCASPASPYPNSSCSYGNMTDIKSDPLYTFLQTTCPAAKASANSPVCEGSVIRLTASNGATFTWTGPGGFSSSLQNPSIISASESMEGTYSVTITTPDGCSSTASTSVIIDPVPSVSSPATGIVCSSSEFVYDITSAVSGTTFIWGRDSVTGITNSAISGQTADPINEILVNSTTDTLDVIYLITPIANGCTGPEFTYIVSVMPAPVLVITDPLPVCSPATIDLTAGELIAGSQSGLSLTYWTDPAATSAYLTPDSAVAGTYYIKGSTPAACYDIKPVTVTVNPLPVLSFTSSSDPMCMNEKRTLTANPAGGTFSVEEGSGSISGNIFTATGPGPVKIAYTYTDICTNKAVQIIDVDEPPVPITGPDQVLEYAFETEMAAELSDSQTGEWMLISGAGQISDISSPVAKISGLMVGENVFNWKVRSGSCEASAEMKITVNDLFIPSVITSNGDGKNDYFKINASGVSTELIVFNRWGNVEYTNSNYQNDWDGKNNNGNDMPTDTYYYVIKFENGLIKKGTVLIIR